MTEIEKLLEQSGKAIDLIKISQRSQHTSTKEALRKMHRCLAEVISLNRSIEERKESTIVIKAPQLTDDLLKKAQMITDKVKGDK